MRKLSFFLVALSLLFCGCSKNEKNRLKIAASPVPHAEMLEDIKDELKKKGINLDIIVVDDYNLPNRMLNDKEVDANFFQHRPFLEEQKKEFGYQIDSFAKIHLEPMGIYSKKTKELASLPEKSTIALPNDPTNESRALKLLEKAELIEINSQAGLKATVADITSNPKQLKFIEVDAPMLPRTLKEVGAAAIPSNFALQTGLNPFSDPLIKERTDSPYANILVIRSGEESREDLQALKEALTSDEMRTFILTKYRGAIIPVF